MRLLVLTAAFILPLAARAAAPATVPSRQEALVEQQFTATVRPFVETYCTPCHGADKPEAELNLATFQTMAAVRGGHEQWALVLERLEEGDMPSKKAKKFPTDSERAEIVSWIKTMRQIEAEKNAGDPGPVLARRLNNAEYDYSIRDLTGVDLRPTKEFPVDPANQAGFDNSGESLTMSPALLKKYLGAARMVAEHLVLKPEGFAFAPHPVVADTDRDKYAVLRIVDFYKQQPTDLAAYFSAAWRYEHRTELGSPGATLAETARAGGLSARYLDLVWKLLTDSADDVGPLAKLRAGWRALPSPRASGGDAALAAGAIELRTYVLDLRAKLVPEVKNLKAPPIQEGSQTLVLWKDRQMAANRRRYDVSALYGESEKAEPAPATKPAAKAAMKPAEAAATPTAEAKPAQNAQQALNAKIQKGGVSLPPAIVTTGSSATFQLAARGKRGTDPDLVIPNEPAERAKYERAFARFAEVFPDAFYITERARVYLDAEKEQKNEGRLLSAGLHSMTGYFRDDGPLYDLVLDEAGRRELDRLWREFDMLASVPQRMHTSFAWFERTDSSYMRDDEFTPYRPEDKSITTQAKIKALSALYLAKAKANDASEVVQGAVKEHFEIVARNILRVEQDRLAAEPSHLAQLMVFAERAYRRPLTTREREGLLAFYKASRNDNGLDHEDAMRDCVASVLMSPHFCYRVDLLAEAAPASGAAKDARFAPLSDYALASRLSYFLWSSLPDAELLSHAAKGDLHEPTVLAAQARRMTQDPRLRNFVVEFGGHWLDFRRFEEHNAVDRERYPAFDNALRSAMFEEPVRFLTALVRDDRSILDCLYGDYTFVNAPLARQYGMPMPLAGAAPDGWARVAGAGNYGRGGLLPMAVFLTANSPGLRTSPVKRGYWVVRRVLGERIPPPPAVVPDLPADEKHLGELTLRETLVKHRADPACASCHARFDSFGLVFEGFGAVGERREKDFGGRPVDILAEFPGGVKGSGLPGLRDYLHASRENDFIENLCRKLVAYGLGRTLIPSDDTLIADLRTRLAQKENRFSALIEGIVTSPQFRTKRALPSSATTSALPE
jgi:hypothetical protein